MVCDPPPAGADVRGSDLRASPTSEDLARQISNEAVLARISPCPAKAVVQKQERFASLELEKQFGFGRGAGAEYGVGVDTALDRLGIM
jgi:hypothetical protein